MEAYFDNESELNVIEENLRVEATVTKCQPISKKLVKDQTFQNGELVKKDVAAVFVTEKSAENEIEVCRGVTSHATVVSSGGSVGSSYRDPGTSPSEAKPQKDFPDCHGTLISLLRVHDGFLISAESRLNECEFIVSGKYVPILKSDIENKIRLIVPTVVVGASGSVRRIKGLWSYLEENVKKEDDVVSILNKVEQYIRHVKLREKSCGMELFVVGVSNHTKKCIAFKTGDIETDTISDTFAAIGSGARIAYDRFSSFSKRTFRGNMNDEIAGYYMLDILLQATMGDISCGGLFHTWKVTSQLCCKLTPQGGIHVTDAAILMHRKFEEFKKIQCFRENQLFVFYRCTYFMANYAYTFADLQSLGVSPMTWPSCLGHIRGEWKLFLATLKDLQEVRTVFEKGDKITSKTGIKPGVRQLQFSRCDREGMHLMTVSVVILMATLDNLEMARETPYLDELLPHGHGKR